MSHSMPVTQRDIARACGVHPSTICLALKNSPAIPLPTRQRVQAVAEELGYRLNAAARNLALLRGDKGAVGSLPIAWLNQEPSRLHWRTDLEARAAYESASRRAGELGYHLEEIWTQEPGMTPSRVVQIVKARGIEGALFPVHRCFDFSLLAASWNGCALLGVNDHRLSEWIDVVAVDHYRNAEMIFQYARRQGGGRMGLALTTSFDAATNGLVQSSYLRSQSQLAAEERVPVCWLTADQDANASVFEEWFGEYTPTLVVTDDASLASRAGRADDELRWIGLRSSGAPFDGGLDESATPTAEMAVECIVEKMRRFERGLRESTRVHLLKGTWCPPRAMPAEVERGVA